MSCVEEEEFCRCVALSFPPAAECKQFVFADSGPTPVGVYANRLDLLETVFSPSLLFPTYILSSCLRLLHFRPSKRLRKPMEGGRQTVDLLLISSSEGEARSTLA